MEGATETSEAVETKPVVKETKEEETKPTEIQSEVVPVPAEEDKAVTQEEKVKKEEEIVEEKETKEEKPVVAEIVADENGQNKQSEAAAPEETVSAPPEEPPASMHFVKIARIPKEILNFMVRNEEKEDTVRINLTQMKLFVTELWKLGRYVNGSVWDECDFPKLDLAIPKCAQKFTIIPDFNVVNAAATEEKVAANMEKYREQEKKQYAKMTDHQKRKTWKDLKREYVITNNVITTAGSAGAENSKLLYSKKPANVEEAIPSQIKPADPLPVAEATGKPGKAANKIDVKNDRKRILSKRILQSRQAAGAAATPAEGQAPTKKPDVNKPNGPTGPKVTPKSQPPPNKNIVKKNGNKPMFNTPKTVTPKPQMKPNMRKGPPRQGGNPWRQEPQARAGYPFNPHPFYQQGTGYPQPNVNPMATRPDPSSQMYGGYRDAYPPRDAYYDPSAMSMMDRGRHLESQAPVGGGNYGVDQGREYRTTFDDYSSRNNFGYAAFASRADPAYDSHVQHGYGSRF